MPIAIPIAVLVGSELMADVMAASVRPEDITERSGEHDLRRGGPMRPNLADERASPGCLAATDTVTLLFP
jgi:hypothetical protein